MQKLIDDFLQALTADGKSPATVKNYRCDLQAFADWLTAEDGGIKRVKYADLRRWTNSMDGAASSRARKIAAVKSFFRHLAKMEVIKNNPAADLDTPKLENKAPKVISERDSAAMLENARNGLKTALKRQENAPLWFRDYAILATLLYTGVRREELTNIKTADVDLQGGQILIHGKGAKERYVYINADLLAVLSEYISVYRGQICGAKKGDYLYPTNKAAKMNVATVNDIVNRQMAAAGVKQKGVSAHNLRKRFATSVYNGTGDFAITSKMLGHSSPTVTMRYVVINEENMKKAAGAVSY